MALFPFKTYDKGEITPQLLNQSWKSFVIFLNISVTEYVCMAWILKICAIELRVICNMGHMNKFEDLIKVFLYNNATNFVRPQKGLMFRLLANKCT